MARKTNGRMREITRMLIRVSSNDAARKATQHYNSKHNSSEYYDLYGINIPLVMFRLLFITLQGL